MTKIDWKNKGTMHKIFDQKKKDEKVKNRESDQIATLYLSTKKRKFVRPQQFDLIMVPILGIIMTK